MYRMLFVVLFVINISYSETFKQILDEALKNSPYIKSFEYQKNAYDGQILKAKSLYNPQINLEFGRLASQTESGFALTSLSITQQLRLWDEKDFAVQSAVLQKKAQEYFYSQQRNILAGQLYQIFYEILFIEEKIKIKENELKNLKELYRFIKKKYEFGDALLIDVLRLEKDISILKIELGNLKADKISKKSYLFSLAGIKLTNIEGDFYKLNDLYNVNTNNLPLLKYYDLMIKSYDSQIDRQRALAKPQISLSIIAEEDPTANGKYEFGIGISSTLPIFYKNQGEIIRLINKKKSLIEKSRQYKLQYISQINAIQNQYKILKSQIGKVDNFAIKSLKESLKIAELGYKEGSITFLELSNIRKQYYQTLIYKAELYYQLHNLYGELIKIGGIKWWKN